MIAQIDYGWGVFEKAADACAAAEAAQKEYVAKYTIEDRKKFIEAIRQIYLANMEAICQSEYEETGYGRYEDKIGKNTGTVMAAPGVEMLPQGMFAGPDGLTVEYYAPFGCVMGVTPVTNPSATVAGNGISNLAAGNGVIFNAHPKAKASTAFAIQLCNKAIVEAGGPENMLTCCKEPTMDTLKEIAGYPAVRLLIGTGGPGMVKTLMTFGKKVVAAGPGNPPTVVDDTVDLKKAAAGLYYSLSFENNLLCVEEKEGFIFDSVFDEFVEEFKAVGARALTPEEAKKVCDEILIKNPDGSYSPNKKYIGKNPNFILPECGVECDGDPLVAFFECDFDHPLVHTEQMMPIFPIVRCKDWDEALERAFIAEKGCWHSATIWSLNQERVTEMGRKMNTTVFVQNGGTMAAFGVGGSGTSAPTIATPTGEGPTGPWTFVRKRRFAMAGGLNYIL